MAGVNLHYPYEQSKAVHLVSLGLKLCPVPAQSEHSKHGVNYFVIYIKNITKIYSCPTF